MISISLWCVQNMKKREKVIVSAMLKTLWWALVTYDWQLVTYQLMINM